jgi:hypothetical protein
MGWVGCMARPSWQFQFHNNFRQEVNLCYNSATQFTKFIVYAVIGKGIVLKEKSYGYSPRSTS